MYRSYAEQKLTMGLFDYRCMITGLSLKSSKTVLILLEKSGDNYAPIALPVFGEYNRLGAIDSIDENQNTKTILQFFQSKIHSGEVKVDWEEVYYNGEFLKSIDTIEHLFTAIERSVTMEYDCVTYNGKRIEYSLTDANIWNEISRYNLYKNESSQINSDTWKAIYLEPLTDSDDLIAQFNNVQNFMNKNQILWTPPNNAEQHYDEDVTDFLEEAKVTFKDEPYIMSGISIYERVLHD